MTLLSQIQARDEGGRFHTPGIYWNAKAGSHLTVWHRERDIIVLRKDGGTAYISRGTGSVYSEVEFIVVRKVRDNDDGYANYERVCTFGLKPST